eukprot:2967156-Rhodomonas_salina.1
MVLLSYARGTVLTQRMVLLQVTQTLAGALERYPIPMAICYSVVGTGLGCAAACWAICGTERKAVCGAPRLLSSTYAATSSETQVPISPYALLRHALYWCSIWLYAMLCHVQYWHSTSLLHATPLTWGTSRRRIWRSAVRTTSPVALTPHPYYES